MTFAPALLTLAALVLEAAIGYPDWLHRIIPHPVTWVGHAINTLETRWNFSHFTPLRRRLSGLVILLVLIGDVVLLGCIIDVWARRNFWVALAAIFIATTGLAQRSLFRHVTAVHTALRAKDLSAARAAVAHIVGRDTAMLDEHGVAVAALESLAESFCDGVVAPAFWLFCAGLAGMFAYKVINTADSIIGHRDERFRDFGWAAARTDDVANLIPARLSGVLIALAAGGGWRVMLRDAGKHASPNAGWPEAAMAGGLKIRLGGATTYDGKPYPRPWFGDGAAPGMAELGRGLRIYLIACGLLWALAAAGGFALWRL